MSLLSRHDLLELKYQGLQQIAKREGIRANLKRGSIVDLLLKKYPEGVQRNVTSNNATSRSLRPSKRQKISSSPEANESVQNWIQGVISSQRSPSSSPAPPVIPGGRVSVSRSPPPAISDQPHVYCFKGARRIRRELVKLVNDTSEMHAEMDETEALLEYATKIYDEAALEIHDFSCLRRGLQVVYANMKRDSTILDGTYLMDSPHREAWKDYAAEQDRLREEELEELDERLHHEYAEKTKAFLEAQEQDDNTAPNTGTKRKLEDVDEEENDLEYV